MNIREFLSQNGYKSMLGYHDYFVNENAEIYRIVLTKTKKEILRPVSISDATTGAKKFTVLKTDGKNGTLMLHNVVYETFRGKFEGELKFIDGNRKNCKLNNLITDKELLDFYNTHRQK